MYPSEFTAKLHHLMHPISSCDYYWAAGISSFTCVSGDCVIDVIRVLASIRSIYSMYNVSCTSLIPRSAADFGLSSSIMIIVLAVPGNLLTILSMVNSASLLRNSTTYFIINLAAADLLFAIINLPMTAVRYALCSWPFGHLLCQLYPFLFYSNVAVSLMTITFITLNR